MMFSCVLRVLGPHRATGPTYTFILTAANNFIFFVGFWMLTLIVMSMADYI